MRPFFFSTIFLFMFSSPSFGNGANGFFIENLERSDNNLDGYSVHYIYSTSGSDWQGYCLYGVKLDSSSVLIPSGKVDAYSLKDMRISKRDSCGDKDTLMQFSKKDLNNDDLLILNPVGPKTEQLVKPKIISFDSVIKSFDLFKKKGVSPKDNLKIGDQYINFKVAYDLNSDGLPELLIFTQTIDYLHTYLLGKKAGKWVILKIEYPL